MSTSFSQQPAPDDGADPVVAEVVLEYPYEFFRQREADWQAPLYFVGGGIGILVAMGGFVLALATDASQLAMHSMTTVPAILACFALIAGWNLLRAARSIRIEEDGVAVVRGSDADPKKILWSDIAWTKKSQNAFGAGEDLTLFDRNGKSLATISGAYLNDDILFQLIQDHVPETRDSGTENVKRKKRRRTALLTGFFGLFLMAAGAGICWDTYNTAHQKQLLQEQGVEGVAQIVDRKLAPNGTTRRLYYRIDLGDGNKYHRENVEIDDACWDALENESTVPVTYVPTNPNISQLQTGQVFDSSDDFTETPVGGYGLSVIGGLMGLCIVGYAIALWTGFAKG